MISCACFVALTALLGYPFKERDAFIGKRGEFRDGGLILMCVSHSAEDDQVL